MNSILSAILTTTTMVTPVYGFIYTFGLIFIDPNGTTTKELGFASVTIIINAISTFYLIEYFVLKFV